MTDNTNKVTIDAEWFAKLYAKANANQVKELRFDNPPYSLWVKIDELKKERDELKRKLELECASCPAVKDRATFDTAMVCLGLKKVSQLYRIAKKEGVKV